MGLFDNIGNLLRGSGKTTEPVTLEAGEVERARVPGCTVKGNGFAWVGGDLVLTNQRLLFTPLNTKDVSTLLSFGLTKAGAGRAVAVVGWFQGQIQQQASRLSAIASVRANREPSLLHPPTMVVQLTDGRALEFGVVATRLSPNAAAANAQARDSFIAAMQRG
jgi:hypothetical protein